MPDGMVNSSCICGCSPRGRDGAGAFNPFVLTSAAVSNISALSVKAIL